MDKNTDEGETLGDGFIWVRVKVDVSQPLCRGRVISLENNKELWVSFKYERLPTLCYWCGSLTHDDRDCELWIESKGTLPTEAQQYSAWIKAPPFVQSRRNLVSVPGFYKTKHVGRKTTSTTKLPEKPPVVIRRGDRHRRLLDQIRKV